MVVYSFVERIFGHALESSHSKSGLVHSLSVCISLLDPRRSAISSPLFDSFGGLHMYASPVPVRSETVNAMLPRLGECKHVLLHCFGACPFLFSTSNLKFYAVVCHMCFLI